jgi:hypothetical protein
LIWLNFISTSVSGRKEDGISSPLSKKVNLESSSRDNFLG